MHQNQSQFLKKNSVKKNLKDARSTPTFGLLNGRTKPKIRIPEEDARFSYTNQKISKNYHSIRCQTARNRNVFDFNPTVNSGSGYVGLNHNRLSKVSDHMIVSSNANERNTFSAISEYGHHHGKK